MTLTTFIAVLLTLSAFTARPLSSEQTPNRHVEMSGKCLESRLDSVVEQQAEHEARLEALERCQEAQSATQLLQEQQSANLDQRLEHLVAMAARLDARAAALDQREAEMDEEVDSETDDVEAAPLLVPMFARVRAPVVPQVRSSNLPPGSAGSAGGGGGGGSGGGSGAAAGGTRARRERSDGREARWE